MLTYFNSFNPQNNPIKLILRWLKNQIEWLSDFTMVAWVDSERDISTEKEKEEERIQKNMNRFLKNEKKKEESEVKKKQKAGRGNNEAGCQYHGSPNGE